MNKSTLLISQVAIQDLESIWHQAQKTSTLTDADALYTLLIGKLRGVANDFTIGKSMENTRDGYRVLNVGNFNIYYRADLSDTVEVIRVLEVV
jgi:toxin ParE1/3/4